MRLPLNSVHSSAYPVLPSFPVSREMYATIFAVLLDPHSTAQATAQFRFWAKRMFRLVVTPTANLVAHENRPVAVKDQIYASAPPSSLPSSDPTSSPPSPLLQSSSALTAMSTTADATRLPLKFAASTPGCRKVRPCNLPTNAPH